jgi:hypothetical protein
MGISSSTRGYRNIKNDEEVQSTKIAYLYHSGLGYIGFIWQLLMALIALTMLCGHFVHNATPTLLGLVVVTFVVYLVFFLLNMLNRGPSFATRPRMANSSPMTTEECNKPCGELTWEHIMTRDLRFHNDQWHFSFVLLSYFFILIFLAVFLGQRGTATPSPDFNMVPIAYSDVDYGNHKIFGFFQLAVLAVAAICGLIWLETHSCFAYTQLISGNSKTAQMKPSEKSNLQRGIFI